jgi:hypothetical protein
MKFCGIDLIRRWSLNNPIGQNRWAIAEGYIPETSHGPEPEMTSHETACLLNTSNQDAHVRITIYFSDREPAVLIGLQCRQIERNIYALTI